MPSPATHRVAVALAALALVAGVPASAGAASRLRVPTAREQAQILAWVGRHRGDAALAQVDRVCVHRRRPRYAVVRSVSLEAGGEGTVLRRRRGHWHYVTGGSAWDGGPVLQDLLRGGCGLRRGTGEPLTAHTVLARDGFGPLRLGMTEGNAQRSTRTRLTFIAANPPCGLVGARALRPFGALTTNGIVRRLSIGAFPASAPRLATAEGLRIGDPEERAIAIYGRPDRREPPAFSTRGEALIYDTTVRGRQATERLIELDPRGAVAEIRVGYRPEVEFVEHCA